MAGGRFADRVRELLADAADHAAAQDWGAARDLARAALALDPGNAEASRLIEAAGAAIPDEGERRQLTVMFCDVVGSTPLSEQRDPEVVREVLRAYQQTCDEVVRRYDGFTARFLGDGILVYFGHPTAHEDDPRRAVQAGLDLLDAMQPVTSELHDRFGVGLDIRVAVHTGVVVRAEMGSTAVPDRDAIVGDTPNLAARLQDQAAPGSLLISDSTYALVRGWFLVVPTGPLELRGIERKVEGYRVVATVPTASRLQAQADLSPFVGRASELEVMEEAWAAAVEGDGRTVVISGPPGVGKSRLADVAARRARASDGTVLVATCSAMHATTALHPVARLLAQVANVDERVTGAHTLPRLWNALDAVGQADSLPYLADLLGVPPEPWSPAPELEGAKLREEVLGRLDRWIRATAERGPVMLLVDDLQWADPTTQELLGRLISGRAPGLLLVLTVREGHPVPWSSPTTLALERLSERELVDLARRLPEGGHLGEDQLSQLIQRSDGIPLFLEELVRASALTVGADLSRRTASIPAALRDLLMARFAAPGVDLRLAQLLATIGLEIPVEVAAGTLGTSPAGVIEQVRPMVQAGLLVAADGGYRFRHQLLADLAYDTQLQPTRRATHERVADALIAGRERGVESPAAVLAHHLEQAERYGDAVEALLAAAEAAQSLAALSEVGELLARGMDLVELVEVDRRADLEFSLRLMRGSTAATAMGFAAPDAIADFEACEALLESSSTGARIDAGPDGTDHVWALTGLWSMFMLQGRLHSCRRSIDGIVARLPEGDLRDYFQSAHGFEDFFQGDWAAAESRLQSAHESLVRVQLPRQLANPNDPRVTGLSHMGMVRTFDCRLSEANATFEEALALAAEQPFPRNAFSTCYAASLRSASALACKDYEAVAHWAQVNQEVAERHGSTFWLLVGGLNEAIAGMVAGEPDAPMRALMSLNLTKALGIMTWLPSFFGTIAGIHIDQGRFEEAAPLLQEAWDVAEQTGCRYWTAELLRRRGEVALSRGDEGGLDLIREGIVLAGHQRNRLVEMWARTSLCRHTGDAADLAALGVLMDDLPLDFTSPDAEDARALLAGRS